MTTDQILLFSLFVAVFALMLWGRFRFDIIAFGALMLAVVLGLVTPDDAFAGFGHPATIIVALVLVVSAGLMNSGAVTMITRSFVDSGRGLRGHIATLGGIGAVLSAFMNNVAALALLMPIDVQTARKADRPPGLTLMPLSFATILGGLVTLIGTPPNIIIAGIREDALGEPFRMFDFAPVGGIAAISGLTFVALLGWRLIPRPGDDAGSETLSEITAFIAELVVPDDSDLEGKLLGDLQDEADSADVALLGIVRNGERVYGTGRTSQLRAGDVLRVEAAPDALEEFRTALKLAVADEEGEKRLRAEGDGVAVVEAVVPHGARIAGKSARSIGLAWRRRTVVLGISRQGRRITSQVARTKVQPGDILLLLIPKNQEADVIDWLGVLALADRDLSVAEDSKAWLAIGLFGGAVALAALGVIYLPVALGVVAVGYVLTGILPLDELYDRIDWPVVVLLGSMIPLGSALETSGGTALIAGGLLSATDGLPAWAVLTLLMVVTMTLSDVLNNAATTIVAAPVAIGMAQALGVSPDPFLMAVAVAASCAFLTPIGHQNNTLILGPGGFRFGDYWRLGLPLEVLIVALGVPLLLVVWPL